MSSHKFKWLFAYRNATANKKNSLVVVLTLSLVFCLLILLLGMKFTFTKIYEYQSSNVYQQTDVVITYDEYSVSRLINNRYIKEDYKDDINYSLSFFNLDVLVDDGSNQYYGSLFSALPYEFETLIDKDITLDGTHTIISDTFAKRYSISIGDTISFTLQDKTFSYDVKEIVKDTGVFSGVAFFIDKEAFYDEFYGLSSLTNLGNVIYIDTASGVDIDTFISTLKEDNHFSNYDIFPSLDWNFINSKAMDLVSMMLALGIIVLIAVIMVLDSLFPIINREYRQHLGVTNTLGAHKGFMWQVNLLHWMIYTIISFVIGTLLSYVVINVGLYSYGLTGFIGIKPLPLLIAFAIVSLFIIARAYIGFARENKMSVAKQTRNKRYIAYRNKYVYVVLSAVIMLLAMFLKQIPQEYRSLIIVASSLYLILNLASIILFWLTKLFDSKRKKSVFQLFQLKYLRTNKHIHQSLRVIIISLLALVLIFSVRGFIYSEIDNFNKTMSFDLAMTNIYDYDDNLLGDIKSYDVTNADSGLLYQDVEIFFNESDIQPCKFFISTDKNHFTDYFDLNIIGFDQTVVSENIPYVILPYNFKMVYNISVGDEVTLSLNYNLNHVTMVVAGYFDTNFDNIIYSNIMNLDSYQTTAIPNSILINTDDKTQVYQTLIQHYSSNMYYILNPDLYFSDYISSAENIVNFFTVFTFFMIICFVVIIFNNTLLVFYGLKNDLAKIKVLGAGKTLFGRNLIKEYLLILMIVLTLGYIEVLILSEHLKYVVLLTNYYKDISSTPLTNLYGCAIVGIVLLSSYIYYFYNIEKIKIVDEIRVL